MNDIERDLRELLTEDAEHVPTPASAPDGLRRRVRLGQAAFASLTGIAVVGIVALGVWALGALPSRDARVPGDQPTTTQTMNGITITLPEPWSLIDPDQAGLNGSSEGTRDLPRLILALSPQPASDLLGCPGIVEGEAPTFLMTVQERPLSLAGDAAAPWPVTLEPMEIPAAESGCYPDWAFSNATWTAEGRTFEAVVGLDPDVSEADREAVFAAFGSMTFAPAGEAPTSVVVTTGTTGGEDWELIASTGPEGLSLSIEGDTFGAGGSIPKPASEAFGLITHVFGTGAQAERLVYGTIPATAVRIIGTDASGTSTEIPVLDIPDEIDPRANAFVIEIPPDGNIAIEAFDANGDLVADGRFGPEPDGVPQEGAVLEDGRHFGYIRVVDPDARTIGFDLAYFLSGEEANQAYQEATGETGPVPNDYFVVNDDPWLRTVPLSPDLRLRLLDWNRCCDTFFDGDLAVFAEAIASQGDVVDGGDRRYSGVSQWWITVEGGIVTEIEEQYAP